MSQDINIHLIRYRSMHKHLLKLDTQKVSKINTYFAYLYRLYQIKSRLSSSLFLIDISKSDKLLAESNALLEQLNQFLIQLENLIGVPCEPTN